MTIFKGSSKNEECCEALTDKNEPAISSNLENRKETDRWFLFVFILCIVMLLPLLIYTLIHSDVNRYNGYDSCGNICGQKNVRNDQLDCSGEDMTLRPFQFSSSCVTEEEIASQCVHLYQMCSYFRDGYFSSSWNYKKNVFTTVKDFAGKLSITYFVPFVTSIILALLIRYLTAITIYIVLIIFWIFLPATSLYAWILNYFFQELSLIYIGISSILFYISIPKIGTLGLVITLMKEASKAIFSIRSILFNITMTSIVSLALVMMSWIMCFCLKTSGVFSGNDGTVEFIPDIYMEVTMYLTPIIFFWVIQFVISIGYLNISEAIISGYFLRNQERCTRNIAFKYHSGTVAMTTLLSMIMFAPRVTLIVLSQIPVLKSMMHYCLRYLDAYFSKNVYIMTAMNGTQLSQSGKRTVELSRSSVGNTEYVNYFGNIVIILIQLLTIIPSIASVLICYNVMVESLPEVILMLLTVWTGTELILGPFKVALSTVFFCICEDNLHKKESNQPHAISKTDYLNSSHKFFEEKVKEKWLSRNLVEIEKI